MVWCTCGYKRAEPKGKGRVEAQIETRETYIAGRKKKQGTSQGLMSKAEIKSSIADVLCVRQIVSLLLNRKDVRIHNFTRNV